MKANRKKVHLQMLTGKNRNKQKLPSNVGWYSLRQMIMSKYHQLVSELALLSKPL